MNTGRYSAMGKTTNPLVEPGYFEAFIALKSDFTTLQEPTLSTTPVLGEAYIIGADHAFTAGKEPIKVFVKQDTIEADSETAGEIDSLRDIWKPKFFIPGDGPKVLEIVTNWLNEDLILFVKDGCGAGSKYIQFGCDCAPCKVTKKTGKTGNLTSGSKGNELELRSFCKYFYNGTLPERA